MDKVLLVDTREKEFYAGQKKLEFVARAGHLKAPSTCPTPVIYNSDWTYKDKAALAAAASPVVGSDMSREIIVYCDSGRVASTWWYMLTQVLGYKREAL